MSWGVSVAVTGILLVCVGGFVALLLWEMRTVREKEAERSVVILPVFGGPERLEGRVRRELRMLAEENGVGLLLDESGDPELARLGQCLSSRWERVEYLSDRRMVGEAVRQLLVANQ